MGWSSGVLLLLSTYGFLKSFGATAFALWLGLALVAAVFADAKGRSATGHFFIAVFLTPLVGLIAIACLPSLKLARTPIVRGTDPDEQTAAAVVASRNKAHEQRFHVSLPAPVVPVMDDDDATGMPRIEATTILKHGVARASPKAAVDKATSKPITLRDGSTEIRSWVARVHRSNADGSSRQRLIEKLVHVGGEVEVVEEPNEQDPDAMAVIAIHKIRLGGGEERGKIGYLATDMAAAVKAACARGGTANVYVNVITGGTSDSPLRNVQLRAILRPRSVPNGTRTVRP